MFLLLTWGTSLRFEQMDTACPNLYVFEVLCDKADTTTHYVSISTRLQFLTASVVIL